MRYCLAVVACILTTGAFAQELPRYEVDERCQEDPRGAAFCIKGVQRTYDRLKGRWSSIPADVRTRCIEELQRSSELLRSYSGLEGCVQRETRPTFRY
jgi:hypothetical protein